MTPDNTHPKLNELQLATAFDVLKNAFQADPTYAWEWQCQLAESQRQVGVDPKPAHQGAAHFLFKHFGVDVTAMQEYKDLMNTWR